MLLMSLCCGLVQSNLTRVTFILLLFAVVNVLLLLVGSAIILLHSLEGLVSYTEIQSMTNLSNIHNIRVSHHGHNVIVDLQIFNA